MRDHGPIVEVVESSFSSTLAQLRELDDEPGFCQFGASTAWVEVRVAALVTKGAFRRRQHWALFGGRR